MATMAVLFGTAMVADALGLSLALGAFVAGLVVSESEYSHQMFAEVLPFRDVFNGLFFASVGLLIDPDAVMNNAWLLVGFILSAIIIKGLIIVLTARLMKLDIISSLVAGVALAQVGEFGLVLAQQGAALKLITAEHYSLVIATAVATMAFTPLVLPWFRNRMKLRGLPTDHPDIQTELRDHVIVVGYGLNGRNVARALRKLNVPVIAVELNQSTVVDSKADDLEIVYGDATRPALLHHLHVERARALVSAIADASATREIVSNARHAAPNLQIVARTRYISEIEPLRKLGANVVVPEELETSIELVGRVLKSYGASEQAIQREKRLLRSERYKHLLEDIDDGDAAEIGELLFALDVAQNKVPTESTVCGKSLVELDFRASTGTTVVAILRDDATIGAPDAHDPLLPGDILVVVGDAEGIELARKMVITAQVVVTDGSDAASLERSENL
jgi:CPA2 family monovalent cation:H+ antiporter-2